MLDFIINPIAGGKHGKKIRKTVSVLQETLNNKNIDFRFHLTSFKGHAKSITKTLIKKGATDIIVVGGDGTLHEVINGFSDFHRVNLGLIPCGTGNDFAYALKIPSNPKNALEIILNSCPKYIDYMQMQNVRGINIIGTGIDVDVLRRYQKLKRKNKINYSRCLVKTLFNFEYTKFNAIIDGQEKTYNSFIACIANGSVYGGGIPICPVANPMDNKLNFLAVKSIPKLKIIRKFFQLKRGKILTFKQTEHFYCKQIKIETEKPCTINVDGELYENIPLEVEIVSNTLKMYRN